MNARCDAHHDGHDCRHPGACQRALTALCERIAARPEVEAELERRQRDRSAA